MGGQSNSNARSTLVAPAEPSLIPEGDLANVSAWDSTNHRWARVFNPDAGGGFSPALAGNGIHAQSGVGQWFARFAQKSIDDGDISQLFYVGFGVDGAAIAYFSPSGSNYAPVEAKVAASGATVTDIVWWQGESDDGVTKAAHLAALEALRTAWRASYGTSINIWAFQVAVGAAGGDMTGVREALAQWATDNADVTLIDLDDLTGGSGHDGTHYGFADGYQTAGERLNAAVFP